MAFSIRLTSEEKGLAEHAKFMQFLWVKPLKALFERIEDEYDLTIAEGLIQTT